MTVYCIVGRIMNRFTKDVGSIGKREFALIKIIRSLMEYITLDFCYRRVASSSIVRRCGVHASSVWRHCRHYYV